MGVIQYALICGYLPFEDKNTSVLYKKIMSGEFSIPKFVSNEGRDLLLNILITDPVKRYSLGDIKKHIWYKQLEDTNNELGLIVGRNPIPIDEKILTIMQKEYKSDPV